MNVMSQVFMIWVSCVYGVICSLAILGHSLFGHPLSLSPLVSGVSFVFIVVSFNFFFHFFFSHDLILIRSF